MRVIDSSVWIEILADGPYAERLLEEVPAAQDIAMPTMIELELAKWIVREGAAALEFEAELVTCDRHFEEMPHVIYLPNK